MPLTVLLTIAVVVGYALGAVLIGLAMFPGAMFCSAVWPRTAALPFWARMLSMCCAAGAAYFLYGFTLVGITGGLRGALRLRLREGAHPLMSAEAAAWGISIALRSPVSITFLSFLLLTPFAPLFYRLMGARIGRDVQINTKSCADPLLLEIGEGSVIGGHATIVSHAFEHHQLVLKKVKIGARVVVGLNAVILPGVEVGDGATIAAGAVVPKNTCIAPGGVYFGALPHRHIIPQHVEVQQREASLPPPEMMETWR